MGQETGQNPMAEAVVRSLASTAKSLRLYPATSPIPAQSVEATLHALSEFFASGLPSLSLTLDREGFSSEGVPLARSTMGVAELVEYLREHGVAQLDIAPSCTAPDILAFLTLAMQDPEAVRQHGGISAALAEQGIVSIHVADLRLTVAEPILPEDDEDFDEFLRNLAKDPEKLAIWFAQASGGDPGAFQEGLMELVRVSGPSGYQEMLKALSQAFSAQRPEAKDALLGLSLDQGPTRDLTGSMFGLMGSTDIASSIMEGSFGENMLALSTALTKLPLEEVTAQVRAEVQAMLPGAGHSAKESSFLDHMIEVRNRTEPEQALTQTDPTYRQVVDFATIDEAAIAQAREAVAGSHGALSAASVRTILRLLDQQQNFELYCSSIDSLAEMVPRLIERGEMTLARDVVSELSRRESLQVGPWPDLSRRVQEALTVATGPRSMQALVGALVAQPDLHAVAADIVRHAGEPGHNAVVAAAISHKAPGLAIAEQLMGRRLLDLLAAQAASAQWFQVGPIAHRLAQESDPRSVQALEGFMSRPDEQSRREVVAAIAEVGGPLADKLLARALRDPSLEVAASAAKAIGKSERPGSAALISARLDEIDIDNAGFALGRELIAALARLPEPAAGEVLDKLATRRTLIKRGHHAEVQDLVMQARQYRARSGDAQ